MCKTLALRLMAALAAVLALAAFAHTQNVPPVPKLIDYQGRLTDAGGTPLNGTYSVRFSVYPTASGPDVAIWTEQRGVTVTDGLFNVTLGGVFPIMHSVFGDSVRYLGVKVGADPELVPRVRLVTVPYAHRVATLDGALGGMITGSLDFEPSTETTGNIMKNGAFFLHDLGTQCTFLGRGAGEGMISGAGTDNTGVGFYALVYNTGGSYNSALGSYAMLNNTEGQNNTASGYSALRENTTGTNNTATGSEALYSNTEGTWNTASGVNALRVNTLGQYNTAVGGHALQNNTTGSNNTATGADALISNTVGAWNTANGVDALYMNTTGGDNVAVGREALRENTVASNNTAVGTAAMHNNTTGDSNTAVGAGALYTNNYGYRNTAYGAAALSANTYGFENTASGAKALRSNTMGIGNTASGALALEFSTGSGNTAMGYYALYGNVDGSMNTAIGQSAGVSSGSLYNTTSIGSGAKADASNKMRFGNTEVTVIEGQVAYTFTSDRNEKENFQPVDGDEILSKIRAIDVSSWNYIGHDPAKFRHYGPVAQDFYAAFGHDDVGTCGDSTTINSGDMAGILMIAVQALEKRTAEVASMKEEIAELREMIRAQAANQQ